MYNLVGAAGSSVIGAYLAPGFVGAPMGAYSAYSAFNAYKNDYLPTTKTQREAFRATDTMANTIAHQVHKGVAPGANPQGVLNPLSVLNNGNHVSNAAVSILAGAAGPHSFDQVDLVARDFQNYLQRVSLPYAM